MRALKGVALGLGALVGLLLLLLLGRQAHQWLLTTPPPPTLVWSGLSAPISLAEAAQRSADRAHSWAADAVLVEMEGAWHPSPDWLQVETPPMAWTCYYYSAAQQALAAITVQGETLLWAPPVEVTTAPEALAPFPPAQGANVAWLSLRAAGAEELLRQRSGATVRLTLSQNNGTPFWEAIAFQGDQLVRVRLNAQTGQVLP